MADKFTHLILDALTRVAAEPNGLPLYGTKTEAGLFPNAAAAKPAAQKCLADDLVRVVAADTRGKAPRDLYGLSDKGWEFLLAAVNPKQVLEDFVRVLEARQGEVSELLATARRMADGLHGLKDAVARVLPNVTAARVARPTPPGPEEPTPSPSLKGGEPDPRNSSTCVGPREASREFTPSLQGGGRGVGLLPAPDLAPAVRAHLAGHNGPTDCTLPDLFRALARDTALTIGEFHDCLRQLCADGAVSLPAWTGPLYALPEPQYALLIGHGIAYYASLRG
ncbi:hypothetical protein [Frigoriglobus tundricola]|uniref:Uncharacterized protein n=1 Tax=Frigoriglobus tundricola TaxID=2774151 RepID=A0A6M5YSP8_9BACT|nr:hypothetical protein [Frigoriglobus tundricola]QJW96333.1 hypothetical protein FTUN_3890 [Frigoriglobus tundricola]